MSVLLLWHEIDKNNPLLRQICSGGKKVNCDAVLSSKASKVFGWLNLPLKKGSGSSRMTQTRLEFEENQSVISICDFIHQKIEKNIFVLDSLLKNKQINLKSCEFYKKEIIDDYLYRAGYIGQRYYFDTITEPDNFFADLDKLFQQYDITAGNLSTIIKAKLRAFKLISGSKLDLGLDAIFVYNSHLDSNEQEIRSASEIITNTSAGKLDSLKLDEQRNLFKAVFPNSVYNPILAQLKATVRKDYIVASYSSEKGLQEYGQMKSTNLKSITGMFLGAKPVFVDFWATWCAPCIKEFAYMAEFKAFAKEHNIGILYVSIDDAGAYDNWKQRIEKSQMEGLHYFGTKEFGNQLPYFEKSRGIPRYILLDKDGTVLIESCEFPSSGKLIPQIKEALEL